jgi:hypothetical protein
MRLTKHYAMKMYWGVEIQNHAFLTSALEADKWLASRPGRFTPAKEPEVPIFFNFLGDLGINNRIILHN